MTKAVHSTHWPMAVLESGLVNWW